MNPSSSISPQPVTTPQGFLALESLARTIWPLVYSEMISAGQMEYMLKMMYAPEVLADKAAGGHHFHLYFLKEKAVGYTHWWQKGKKARLEKIYLHPGVQGGGNGRSMLAFVESEARQRGAESLSLNVNRSNPAFHFYLKQGFTIESEVDVPIGGGFFMNDYIMIKSL